MLQTNLATRPFYNERLVHWALGLAAAVLALVTVVNVVRYISLSRHVSVATATAAREEQQAREFTVRAAEVRRSIDQKALERVTKAALEVNGIIDARTFSWTGLFNDIETTLPPNVMLTAVTPQPVDGGIRVKLVVLGRTVEGIDTFIERLEQTGRFANVLAVAEQVTEEGLFQTTIEGSYRDVPATADRAAAPAPRPSPAPTSTGGGS
jgi:hypothetical protein